jgi:ABC-type Fe3+-siderophore transport system permease subunit
MLAEIFTFVVSLTGSIFGFVSNILEFAFSLPLWFILTSNAIGIIRIVAVVYLIVRKRNNSKASSETLKLSNKT